MADNQKYYYLKLKENFFESESMIMLESLKDGYIYSNILLKLYLRSLKNNGKLMFNDRIPYSPTMIATITRHSVGDVEKALKIFTDLALIEMLDNGAIYMLDLQLFIGLSSTEGERKKITRLKIQEEKTLIGQSKTLEILKEGHSSDICPPKIEIEKEIELELDKEIDIEPQDEPAIPTPPLQEKSIKHKYGEFKNVLLTDEQYNSLLSKLGQSLLEACIKKLDEGIEQKGYKYKNFSLTIQGWVLKAVKEDLLKTEKTIPVTKNNYEVLR